MSDSPEKVLGDAFAAMQLPLLRLVHLLIDKGVLSADEYAAELRSLLAQAETYGEQAPMVRLFWKGMLTHFEHQSPGEDAR
jgi:hypothetical protein